MHIEQIRVRGFRASAENEITCRFPGRFCALTGPNNGGKTTISEALYLAHPHRFPRLHPPTSETLGPSPREIDIAFSFERKEDAESRLGQRFLAESKVEPAWQRTLQRNLGVVRSRSVEAFEEAESFPLVFLPATRNPIDDLARREAESLVELLRSEQARRRGHRSLSGLRLAAESLLDRLVKHPLIDSVETRIATHLASLSGGVQEQFPFFGRQRVDDAFLARVLELLLATVNDRVLAQRLELSGLGYVNLLHIAVTLAAIPGDDPVGDKETEERSTTEADQPSDDDLGPGEAPAEAAGYPEPEVDIDAENDVAEDSFFPSDLLHATVVIEEPEAHLHPQLQRGLVNYLRRTVRERPEVQIVITTHSPEIITSCDPIEVVVLRRESDGTPVHRLIRDLPLPQKDVERIHRMTALHFDASRTATFLAERVVLVEGITDALVLRQLGRAWAGDDQRRLDQVETLTIVPVGTRVGEWTLQLLATPGYELVQRVAILSDTDSRPINDPHPAPPRWLARYDTSRVRRFVNHPTLEPSLTPGNETFVADAFETIGLNKPEPTDVIAVDDAFRSSPRKAEFAYALAGRLRDALLAREPVTVPAELIALFEFILSEPEPEPDDSAPDA